MPPVNKISSTMMTRMRVEGDYRGAGPSTQLRRSTGTNSLQEGDCVEYYSETHATWVDATIVAVPNKTNSQGVRVYHLDIKQNAAITKIRFKEYLIGTQVIYKVGDEEYRAEVQSKGDINTYRIQYQDPVSKKSRIAETHVRRLKPLSPGHAKGSPPARSANVNGANQLNGVSISHVIDDSAASRRKQTLIEPELHNSNGYVDVPHRSVSQKSSFDLPYEANLSAAQNVKNAPTSSYSLSKSKVQEVRIYGGTRSQVNNNNTNVATNRASIEMPKPANTVKKGSIIDTGYSNGAQSIENTIGGQFIAPTSPSRPTQPEDLDLKKVNETLNSKVVPSVSKETSSTREGGHVWAIGDKVEYYSETHKTSIISHVTKVNRSNGVVVSVDLDVKRGAKIGRITLVEAADTKSSTVEQETKAKATTATTASRNIAPSTTTATASKQKVVMPTAQPPVATATAASTQQPAPTTTTTTTTTVTRATPQSVSQPHQTQHQQQHQQQQTLVRQAGQTTIQPATAVASNQPLQHRNSIPVTSSVVVKTPPASPQPLQQQQQQQQHQNVLTQSQPLAQARRHVSPIPVTANTYTAQGVAPAPAPAAPAEVPLFQNSVIESVHKEASSTSAQHNENVQNDVVNASDHVPSASKVVSNAVETSAPSGITISSQGMDKTIVDPSLRLSPIETRFLDEEVDAKGFSVVASSATSVSQPNSGIGVRSLRRSRTRSPMPTKSNLTRQMHGTYLQVPQRIVSPMAAAISPTIVSPTANQAASVKAAFSQPPTFLKAVPRHLSPMPARAAKAQVRAGHSPMPTLRQTFTVPSSTGTSPATSAKTMSTTTYTQPMSRATLSQHLLSHQKSNAVSMARRMTSPEIVQLPYQMQHRGSIQIGATGSNQRAVVKSTISQPQNVTQMHGGIIRCQRSSQDHFDGQDAVEPIAKSFGLEPSHCSIKPMEGFSGGCNEGIWFFHCPSGEKFVVKVCSSERTHPGAPTEHENIVDIAQKYSHIFSDDTISFPVRLYTAVLNNVVRWNLQVMREAPGQRLSDLMAELWHFGKKPELWQVFRQIGLALPKFHKTYQNRQHGDFQPSNIFCDLSGPIPKITMIDIGGMGFNRPESDFDHFVRALEILAPSYGPDLIDEGAKAFEEGFNLVKN